MFEIFAAGYVELREEFGDTFEHANTTGTIYQALRKRSDNAEVLRIILRFDRAYPKPCHPQWGCKDPIQVQNDEFAIVDDIRVIKMRP